MGLCARETLTMNTRLLNPTSGRWTPTASLLPLRSAATVPNQGSDHPLPRGAIFGSSKSQGLLARTTMWTNGYKRLTAPNGCVFRAIKRQSAPLALCPPRAHSSGNNHALSAPVGRFRAAVSKKRRKGRLRPPAPLITAGLDASRKANWNKWLPLLSQLSKIVNSLIDRSRKGKSIPRRSLDLLSPMTHDAFS